MILALRRVSCDQRWTQGLWRAPGLTGDSLLANTEQRLLSLLVTQLVTAPEQAGGPTELGAADKPSGKTVAGMKKYTLTTVAMVPKAVKKQVHTAGLEKGVRRKQATP